MDGCGWRRVEGTVKMELKDQSSRVSNGEGHVLGKREEWRMSPRILS